MDFFWCPICCELKIAYRSQQIFKPDPETNMKQKGKWDPDLKKEQVGSKSCGSATLLIMPVLVSGIRTVLQQAKDAINNA